MQERAAPPRTLGSHTLKVPISTLQLPKPISVASDSTVHDAVQTMQKGRFGAVLVVDKKKLVGIFTERDVLIKLAAKGKDWKKEKIADWMTKDPESLVVTASLAFALNMMSEGGFRHVPLVNDKNEPVSVLSVKDIVRYICSFFEKEIKNLPPRPGLLHPDKDGG
jgi:CBS domain-containing protein